MTMYLMHSKNLFIRAMVGKYRKDVQQDNSIHDVAKNLCMDMHTNRPVLTDDRHK